MEKLVNKNDQNIKAGFEKSGIYPLNRNRVLALLPKENEDNSINTTNTSQLSDNLTIFLKNARYGEETVQKKRKKKLNIPPGKSIKVTDLDITSDVDDPEVISDISEENMMQMEEENSINDDIREPEIQCSTSTSGKPGQMPINILKNNIEEGTWVAVNYGRIKPKLKKGKVLEKLLK